MSFLDLPLHPALARAIHALGWTEPTPIQRESIPVAISGRDVLGAAQTGSGKTAAFTLPILQHLLEKPAPGPRALVLVPTRELALQVEEMVRSLSKESPLRVATIMGGVGYDAQRRAVASGVQFIVATPGRLLDHLESRAFSLQRITHVVLDEADRMLDMGFLPDIRSILGQLPKERQTFLFSATLAPEIERIASFALRDPVRVEIARPATVAEGISQVLYPVTQDQKSELLLALLKNAEMRSVVVFCRTKHGAERVSLRIAKAGYKVEVLHSNRTQGQRMAAMESFRQGRAQILVATDIAARGIDVKDISHVVNYDVPQHSEDYVHRVGRTARAYGVGDAITFMDPQEQQYVTAIEKFINVVFPRAIVPNFPYRILPKLDAPKTTSNPWQKAWRGRRAAIFRRPRSR